MYMVNFLQDLMDVFFKGSSATEKGTLFHLKNVFGRRSVTKDIGETFNHAADFIKFITHGYAILAAMHVLDMKNLSDVIDIEIETMEEKKEYIQQLARKVVDLIWQPCDITALSAPVQ